MKNKNGGGNDRYPFCNPDRTPPALPDNCQLIEICQSENIVVVFRKM
jgi:hypothetical protein